MVKIHGKEYTTVAERIASFKSDHPDWTLTADIIRNDDIVIMKATIVDENGVVRGCGHAEEVRGATKINQTSALENCETSAWGRALASCNYGGEQIASANEINQAIINQHVQDAIAKYIHQSNVLKGVWGIITDVKDRISDGDHLAVIELMDGLGQEVRDALNIAPTKGGIFTTEENKFFMSQEYQEVRSQYYQEKNK